jgi:hypothetical protein
MDQNRLNRRADLAIALVALVTAVVTLGPWRFRGVETGEPSASQGSPKDASVESSGPPPSWDFRACDRDWNHVNDFWTTNMTDLYRMTSVEGTKEVPLLEIDPGEEE